LKLCLPFSLLLRGACLLLAFCAVNVVAAHEIADIQFQTWLTAVDGFFYGILSLAFIVNILIWIANKQSIQGFFVGLIIFSMSSSLMTDHSIYRLVLSSGFEQKRILDLWLFAGMTSSAIGFAAQILCVKDTHSLIVRIANWIALSVVVMVLPAAIWVQATPVLWNLAFLVFSVFWVTALIASIRNIYEVRSLENSLVALAFIFFLASQWFGICVMVGLLPEAPIHQIVWMLGLILSLTLLQAILVIQLFNTRNNNGNNETIKIPINVQADHQSKHAREQERLYARLMHDFKTPLAIIDSSVQSLTMLEHEEDPQRTLRYNRIRRAVMRINDLLMQSTRTEKNISNGAEDLPIGKLIDKK